MRDGAREITTRVGRMGGRLGGRAGIGGVKRTGGPLKDRGVRGWSKAVERRRWSMDNARALGGSERA